MLTYLRPESTISVTTHDSGPSFCAMRMAAITFAPDDVRLLEVFAVQVTVALEYVRLTRESLVRERLR